MKKITTFVFDYDKETGKNVPERMLEAVLTDEEYDELDITGGDEIEEVECDGDCENCPLAEIDDESEDECEDVEREDDDDDEVECDGDCENCPYDCEDEDDDEYDEDDEPTTIEIRINLFDLARKVLSMTALAFSAATAVKAWRRLR